MNVAEWIIVAILSITLLIFLIMGIALLAKLINLSKEIERIAVEGQDIARNANGIAANIKGMTAIGGVVEMFVDKYIAPKVKEKVKEHKKEAKDGDKKAK